MFLVLPCRAGGQAIFFRSCSLVFFCAVYSDFSFSYSLARPGGSFTTTLPRPCHCFPTFGALSTSKKKQPVSPPTPRVGRHALSNGLTPALWLRHPGLPVLPLQLPVPGWERRAPVPLLSLLNLPLCSSRHSWQPAGAYVWGAGRHSYSVKVVLGRPSTVDAFVNEHFCTHTCTQTCAQPHLLTHRRPRVQVHMRACACTQPCMPRPKFPSCMPLSLGLRQLLVKCCVGFPQLP